MSWLMSNTRTRKNKTKSDHEQIYKKTKKTSCSNQSSAANYANYPCRNTLHLGAAHLDVKVTNPKSTAVTIACMDL